MKKNSMYIDTYLKSHPGTQACSLQLSTDLVFFFNKSSPQEAQDFRYLNLSSCRSWIPSSVLWDHAVTVLRVELTCCPAVFSTLSWNQTLYTSAHCTWFIGSLVQHRIAFLCLPLASLQIKILLTGFIVWLCLNNTKHYQPFLLYFLYHIDVLWSSKLPLKICHWEMNMWVPVKIWAGQTLYFLVKSSFWTCGQLKLL